MKIIFFVITIFTSNLILAQNKEWHVKPYTYPDNYAIIGDGLSIDTAWSLQYALSNPGGIIQPGDIIWLHGGIYKGRFTSYLNGSISNGTENYIKVKSYPREWATIDGNISTSTVSDPNVPPSSCVNPVARPDSDDLLVSNNSFENYNSYLDEESDSSPILDIKGGYVIFENFEVTCLGLYSRVLDDSNLNNGFHKIHGINHTPLDSNKPKIKLINLVVRNVPGSGIGSWKGAADSEIYGCVIYNNGYIWFNSNNLATDGSFQIFGKSPGIYTQNSTNLDRKITNNIIFNNYDSGIFVWSANTTPTFDYLKNYLIKDNILFNNGNPGRRHKNTDNPCDPSTGNDSKPNLVIDSGSSNQFNHPTNVIVNNNFFYQNSLNYVSGMRVNQGNNINIYNNYIFKGTLGGAFNFNNDNLTFTQNLYWGKKIDFGATVSSYNSKNWNFNNNNYYKWDYKFDEMYQIPNPNNISSTITVSFADFKTRYSSFSVESLSSVIPIKGGNSLLYFNQVPPPFSSIVKIIQNQYNPNLFYVTIFNPLGNNTSVTSLNVSFSQYNIAPDKNYIIRDIQNYFANVTQGQYNGSSVNFSLTSTDLELPNGYYNTPTFEFRKKDFVVYSIEFVCLDSQSQNIISFDKIIQNQTDVGNLPVYLAKRNITFGLNYVASSTANIIAKAGNQIIISPNSRIASGANFHAYIEDLCPDTPLLLNQNSYRKVNTNSEYLKSENIKKIKNFVIYPNPNNGIFELSINNVLEFQRKTIKVNIIDINGRLIHEQNIETDDSETFKVQLNISSITNGLYFVRLSSQGYSETLKFIKK